MATITTTAPKTTSSISTTTTLTEYVFDKSQSDITFSNSGACKVNVLVKSLETYSVELLPGQTKTINNQRIFSFKTNSDGNSTLKLICSPWEYEEDQESVSRNSIVAQLENMTIKTNADLDSRIVKTGYVSRAMKKLLAGTGVVAILGDSITDAGNNTASTGGASAPAKGYASLVSAFLTQRYTTPTFYNRGKAGESVSQATARIFDDLTKSNPDLVIVEVGTNDWNYSTSLVNFNTYYTNLINLLTTMTNADILCIGLGWFNGMDNATHNAISETEYNKIIQSICANYGIGYVDWYSCMKRADTQGQKWVDITFAEDPVHPNDAGHALLAQEVETWLDYAGCMNENSYRNKTIINAVNSIQPDDATRIFSSIASAVDVNASYYFGKTFYVERGVIGADAYFNFYGTSFKLIYTKSFNYGIFDVYVDGVKKTTIDGYSGTISFSSIAEITGLDLGFHFVKIIVTGKNASAGNYSLSIETVLIKNIEKEVKASGSDGVAILFNFYTTPYLQVTTISNCTAYVSAKSEKSVTVVTTPASGTFHLSAKGY